MSSVTLVARQEHLPPARRAAFACCSLSVRRPVLVRHEATRGKQVQTVLLLLSVDSPPVWPLQGGMKEGSEGGSGGEHEEMLALLTRTTR